ncbi:lipoate--protein ligase family protein [Carboxydothermus ferrireducens]|uniref:Octanoyltransferase LipM n=1 Tax=Carboxydothermus ferrireducens DSM 11255 TaxID=1119529 RepID=A0ABX2R5D5_9THEO|nr:biotin/lipoate A/B protein ligase family protein [Carboxydothermus ferrireducens]NYE56373.1 lipoate-protein ligase A [Carboxydothermus ferrireducens DSM 11255]
METWRFIDHGSFSGAENMAIDEALLQEAINNHGAPVLRFYTWTRPTLSLGYFQKAQEEVDFSECEKLGVDVVRRPTGGRAVLHEFELTYSIVGSIQHPKLSGTVLESYLKISKGLLLGLKNLGIEGEIAEGKKTSDLSAICFEAPSWYELTVMGRKVIGSAQVRRGDYLLQHGAIVIKMDVDKLFRVLKFKSLEQKERIRASFHRKAGAIHDFSSREFSLAEIKEAFLAGFSEGFEVNFIRSELSLKERELSRQLLREKYNTREWLFRF